MYNKKLLFVSIVVAILLILTYFGCNTKTKDYDYSLYPVKVDDKWGYVDSEGNYEINPQFDYCGFFKEGVARVKSDDKWGFIDKKGIFIVSPQYYEATDFFEGCAVVVDESSYPYYIDKKGNKKFDAPKCQRASIVMSGKALFAEDDKFGFIDETGSIITNATYNLIYFLENGLYRYKLDDKIGYLNKELDIQITPQFEKATNFSKNGTAAVMIGGKWGYVNGNGMIIINPQFDQAEPFSDNDLALIKMNDKYGYINKEGNIVINPQYDIAKSFIGGIATYYDSKNEKWGIIDEEGKTKVTAQFDEIYLINSDILPVKFGDKYGFIDKNGKYVVNPQFDTVGEEIIKNKFVTSTYIDIESAYDYLDENISEKLLFGELKLEEPVKYNSINNLFSNSITNKSRYYIEAEGLGRVNDFIELESSKTDFNGPIYETIQVPGPPKYNKWIREYQPTSISKEVSNNPTVDKITLYLKLSKHTSQKEYIIESIANHLRAKLNSEIVEVNGAKSIKTEKYDIRILDFNYSTIQLEIKLNRD
jgi:hypothetical protein